ncbi:MAG: cation:proton antiporter [Myxococcota bacterium]
MGSLIAILAVTRVVVLILRRFGQTDVAGELLAGFMLGPSLLGAISPQWMAIIFPDDAKATLSMLGQVGLVLLMFEIGLRFELRSAFLEGKKAVAAIAAASILVPLSLGAWLGPFFFRALGVDGPGFTAFFAIALSITAIPMLGRIFMELGLTETRTAGIVIGAASINDVASWLLLGGLALQIQGGLEPSWVLIHLGSLALFVAGILWVVRPLLKRALARHLEKTGTITSGAITTIIILVLSAAALAKLTGVVAVLGSMLLGIALHDETRFVRAWEERAAPLVRSLLLPVFFTNTGLRVDVGLLGSGGAAMVALGVLALGFVAKLVPVFLAARAADEPARVAGAMAIGMNTRGMMAFVALDAGHELGVVPGPMFTSLALMALLSDFLPTPFLRRLLAKEKGALQEMSSTANR